MQPVILLLCALQSQHAGGESAPLGHEAWKVVEFEYCDDFLTEYTSASGQKHYVVRGKYTMERTPGRALHVHDIDLYRGHSPASMELFDVQWRAVRLAELTIRNS